MEPWLRILLAIVVFTSLSGLFALGYVLNKRTPKPAGCEDMEAACSSCPVASCGHHTSGKED
ncbi:MAG: hypothetical protein AB7E23_00265 [Bacilli bacterium]|jgi:hypothetical protein